jgi:hypothetical protein
MSEPSAQEYPSWYGIDALLNTSSQVMPDWDWPEEDLVALAKKLGKNRPLADPVSVSSDGILLDGRQRLTSMRMAGRTRIYASDVHVIEDANRDNAFDFMVDLNDNRRHLTPKQRQELAHMLVTKRKWSQVKVAKHMRVTQGRVSQWVSAEKAELAADEDAPTTDVDQDAITPRDPAQDLGQKFYGAWHVAMGKAMKKLAAADKQMETLARTPIPDDTTDEEQRAVRFHLGNVIGHAESLQKRLDRLIARPQQTEPDTDNDEYDHQDDDGDDDVDDTTVDVHDDADDEVDVHDAVADLTEVVARPDAAEDDVRPVGKSLRVRHRRTAE